MPSSKLPLIRMKAESCKSFAVYSIAYTGTYDFQPLDTLLKKMPLLDVRLGNKYKHIPV